MYFNKEEREDYERRFNAYIMRIIKNVYIQFRRKERRKELSLNDFASDGYEFIEMIAGEDDIKFKESLAPKELELLFEDKSIYRAVKSLTYKEKLAIFLCVVLEMNKKDVAKILGFKSDKSVYKVCNKAIVKIRKKIIGGIEND